MVCSEIFLPKECVSRCDSELNSLFFKSVSPLFVCANLSCYTMPEIHRQNSTFAAYRMVQNIAGFTELDGTLLDIFGNETSFEL